jgi:hypothetical protein
MKRIEVSLAGVTPLLMNRMSDDQLLALHAGDRRKFKSRREPREEATRKVYQTRDGDPYLPTENLMACLISAGMYIKLDGKRQMSTKQSTLLPGFLTIEDAYLPLVNNEESPAAWEVDMRQGRNPNGGEAVCVIRPRFDQWAFKTSFLIDGESIGEDVIRELVDIAGSRIGIGDFRPQRRGVFGKFKVVGWHACGA